LRRCDEVVVLMLDGWERSEGVQAEIRIAEALGKPVRYRAAEDANRSPMPLARSILHQYPRVCTKTGIHFKAAKALDATLPKKPMTPGNAT
jgi:hypothetical protein